MQLCALRILYTCHKSQWHTYSCLRESKYRTWMVSWAWICSHLSKRENKKRVELEDLASPLTAMKRKLTRSIIFSRSYRQRLFLWFISGFIHQALKTWTKLHKREQKQKLDFSFHDSNHISLIINRLNMDINAASVAHTNKPQIAEHKGRTSLIGPSEDWRPLGRTI